MTASLTVKWRAYLRIPDILEYQVYDILEYQRDLRFKFKFAFCS